MGTVAFHKGSSALSGSPGIAAPRTPVMRAQSVSGTQLGVKLPGGLDQIMEDEDLDQISQLPAFDSPSRAHRFSKVGNKESGSESDRSKRSVKKSNMSIENLSKISK